MKTKILLCLLVVSSFGYAQSPILHFESAESSQYAQVESDPIIDHGSLAGANQTWNFTLSDKADNTSDVQSIPTAQELIDYPLATSVFTTSNATEPINKLFTNKTGSIVAFAGVESNGLTLSYTDAGVIGDFSLSYLDSSTNAVSGDFTFEAFAGGFSGDIVSTVDAYGTLNVNISNLPSANFTKSVTRLKIVQNITLLGLIPASQTSYHYYESNGDLVFRTSRIIAFFSGIVDIDQTITESLLSSTLSVENNTFDKTGLVVFPNPIKSTLNFSTNSRVQSVSVYDISGRQVMKMDTNKNSLSVEQLKSGMYLVNVYTDKGIVTSKFIKK